MLSVISSAKTACLLLAFLTIFYAESLWSYILPDKEPAVSISSEKTEFNPGDNIYINLKISSKTETPLYILVPNPYGYLCRIIVTDRKTGNSIIIKYPRGPWKDVSYRALRITTDSSFDQTISVGKLEPGRYSFQVKYNSSPALAQKGVWAGSALSNELEVVVMPKQEHGTSRAFSENKPGLLTANNGRRTTFVERVSSRFRQTEIDRNGDGSPDLWEDLTRKIIIRDTDFNGVPDTWDYFKDNRLFRSGYDTDGDGMPDVFSAR